LDADFSDRTDKNKKLNQPNPLDPRPIILDRSSVVQSKPLENLLYIFIYQDLDVGEPYEI
jgi:hypothetical protein